LTPKLGLGRSSPTCTCACVPAHALPATAMARLVATSSLLGILAVSLGGCGGGGGAKAPIAGSSDEAKLWKLDLKHYPDARCLDGSPGAFYFKEASHEASKDKWVIALQGGGECTTNAECTQRSATILGSSKNYNLTKLLTQFGSSDAEENPAMHGWNHVRVMYCTGDLHLGQMNATDKPEWGWARFAGARIVDAVLDHLSKSRSLASASTMVWTGESAGGIAATAHLDEVADRFPAVRVVGAPIAGYYWNDATPYHGPGQNPYVAFGKDGFKVLYSLYRMFVPRRCVQGPYKDEPWVCGLADFSFRTMATPVFFTEAEVDSVQLQLHAGLTCDPRNSTYTAEAKYCVEWGRNMTEHLQKVVDVARQSPTKAGLFSPACRMHTTFSKAGPFIDGLTYAQAFDAFLSQTGDGSKAVVHRDNCCSGHTIQYQSTCPEPHRVLRGDVYIDT